MDLDVIIGSRLGLDVSMAPIGSAGLSDQGEPTSLMMPGLQLGCI